MTQWNGRNYDIHRAPNELWTVGVGPNHDTTNMRGQTKPQSLRLCLRFFSHPSWTPAYYDFSSFHVDRLIKSWFSSHTQQQCNVRGAAHSVLSSLFPLPRFPASSSANPLTPAARPLFTCLGTKQCPMKMHRLHRLQRGSRDSSGGSASSATRNEVLSSQIDFGHMLLISCW